MQNILTYTTKLQEHEVIFSKKFGISYFTFASIYEYFAINVE